MSERYVFPLRYDEDEMKRAVDVFVLRSLFTQSAARIFVPLALIALSLAMLALAGEGRIALLLAVVAVFALAVLVYAGWRRHRRQMREKIEAARGKFCLARLCDEGLVIEAGGPAPRLEWKSIKAVWPAGPTLLLILSTNHFVALPIARAPQEALAFLRARAAG